MKMDLCKLFAVVLFCLSLSGCNSCTSKKDGSRSDVMNKNADEKNYEFTFNGIRMNSDMSLEDLKRVNPDIRIERNKTPGFNSIIGSSEPYTYYEVYSPSEDRACVIVPYKNNSEIYSITFLTDDYKTPENISIGSTWGEVVQAYPNIEFWFLFEWFDYVSYSYKQCVYLHDPATCTGFIFKESQFSQTQRNSIYEAVGETDYDKQFFVSSFSSSVYQLICSSVTVDQIIIGNCDNKSETQQQSETNNIRDIDENTSEISDASGMPTTSNNNNVDLVGTKWVYQGNCFGNSRYEVLEILANGVAKITINNEAPYYGEYIYTDSRKEMSFLRHLNEQKGTKFYIYKGEIYFSDSDWSDSMFETCDHQHKIFKQINAAKHKSEDKVIWTFSIPFDYKNYQNNKGGELLLPNGKKIQYNFYVSVALGSTAFDKIYFYSTGSENPNLIYQYNISLMRPSGRKYPGGYVTNWIKGVETQSFDTKEWKDNKWNTIKVELTR